MIFVKDYVVNQLEELFGDQDGEDVETGLQAQTDLSDFDRQQLLNVVKIEEVLITAIG